MQEIAEQAAIIALTDSDHRYAGLADIGEIVDVGQWQVAAGDVDHQQFGRLMIAEIFDRVLDSALPDRCMGQHHVADDLVDRRMGVRIGTKGDELSLIGTLPLSGSGSGCGCSCGRHQLTLSS